MTPIGPKVGSELRRHILYELAQIQARLAALRASGEQLRQLGTILDRIDELLADIDTWKG